MLPYYSTVYNSLCYNFLYINGMFQYFHSLIFLFSLLSPIVSSDRSSNTILYIYKYVYIYTYICIWLYMYLPHVLLKLRNCKRYSSFPAVMSTCEVYMSSLDFGRDFSDSCGRSDAMWLLRLFHKEDRASICLFLGHLTLELSYQTIKITN
jgi:hypothetical protein